MEKLIARLASAAAGSRELDEAIGKLAGYEAGVDIGLSPHYTTSLDSALTLVPAGSHIAAQFDTPEAGCDTAASVVLSYGEKRLGSGGSITPALALCIAALRARQAMESA